MTQLTFQFTDSDFSDRLRLYQVHPRFGTSSFGLEEGIDPDFIPRQTRTDVSPFSVGEFFPMRQNYFLASLFSDSVIDIDKESKGVSSSSNFVNSVLEKWAKIYSSTGGAQVAAQPISTSPQFQKGIYHKVAFSVAWSTFLKVVVVAIKQNDEALLAKIQHKSMALVDRVADAKHERTSLEAVLGKADSLLDSDSHTCTRFLKWYVQLAEEKRLIGSLPVLCIARALVERQLGHVHTARSSLLFGLRFAVEAGNKKLVGKIERLSREY